MMHGGSANQPNGDDNGQQPRHPQQQQAAAQGKQPSVVHTGITHPGQNDVKFGRGGDTNYHVGNFRFRFFVSQYRDRYQAATKAERQLLVQEVLNNWRNQDPPGRFVCRTDPSLKEKSLWHDVGDEVATRKTIKVLGEGLGGKKKKSHSSSDSRGTPKRRRSDGSTSASQSSSGASTSALALPTISNNNLAAVARASPRATRSDPTPVAVAAAAAAAAAAAPGDWHVDSNQQNHPYIPSHQLVRNLNPGHGQGSHSHFLNHHEQKRASFPITLTDPMSVSGTVPSFPDNHIFGTDFLSHLALGQQVVTRPTVSEIPVAASLTNVFEPSSSYESDDSLEDEVWNIFSS